MLNQGRQRTDGELDLFKLKQPYRSCPPKDPACG